MKTLYERNERLLCPECGKKSLWVVVPPPGDPGVGIAFDALRDYQCMDCGAQFSMARYGRIGGPIARPTEERLLLGLREAEITPRTCRFETDGE